MLPNYWLTQEGFFFSVCESKTYVAYFRFYKQLFLSAIAVSHEQMKVA